MSLQYSKHRCQSIVNRGQIKNCVCGLFGPLGPIAFLCKFDSYHFTTVVNYSSVEVFTENTCVGSISIQENGD